MRLRIILCLLTTLLALAAPRPAYANIAPPLLPGGNIRPSQATKVQMVAEHVLMTVKESTPDTYVVEVTADFVMLNRGDADEQLRVRFPLKHVYDQYEPATARDFKVWVDQTPVPTTTIQEPYLLDDLSIPIPWAEFEVLFRPNQYVPIRVSYITDLANYGFIAISYILGTGAGWYQTIGMATVTISLPYALNALDLSLFSSFIERDNVAIINNEIIWYWYDYEPQPYEEIYLTMMHPRYWKGFHDMKIDFNDIDSVINASRQYQGWFPRSDFLYLAEIIIMRALTLHPNNVRLHEEMANVYYLQCCGDVAVSDFPKYVEMNSFLIQMDGREMRGLKHEVEVILTLDPTNQQALAYKSAIEQAEMIIASQTPSPNSTVTPRPSPSPTATLRPSPSPTATLRPSPSPTATLRPSPSLTATLRPSPSPTATVALGTVAATFTPSPAAMRRDQAATNPVGSYLLIGVVGIIIGFAAGAFVTKKWW